MESEKWKKVIKVCLVLFAGLLMGLLVLTLAGSTWDYTNSSNFCASCHTMEVVTSSYRTSAHAEVSCTSCHLGVGFSPPMLFKKATEVNQVFKTITGTYEKPIRVRNHVPATKSCESCHYTDVFYSKRLKVKEAYDVDEQNTKIKSAMLFNVGGGNKAQGIHWHVQNKIMYGKDAEGKIAYVEVEKTDGQKGVYSSVTVRPDKMKQLDCIDCHNRVAHEIYKPDQVVDEYLLVNKLDPALPFIKKEATRMLETAKGSSPEEWNDSFLEIVSFYRQNYPQVYNERKTAIEQLPATLEEMAGKIIFPNMQVTWETYKNNLGHEGCFQCHNDKLKLLPDKSDTGLPQSISTSCQLCHSMPVAAGADKEITIELK